MNINDRIEIGSRVEIVGYDFLPNGYIKAIVEGLYLVKVDKKIYTNEDDWEAGELFMSRCNLRLIEELN